MAQAGANAYETVGKGRVKIFICFQESQEKPCALADEVVTGQQETFPVNNYRYCEILTDRFLYLDETLNLQSNSVQKFFNKIFQKSLRKLFELRNYGQ